MRVFYFLSSCDSCKRIQAELKLDSSVTQIDIKKSPLTAPQLEQLHTLAGSYEVLFSKRAQLYKQRNLKEQVLYEGDFKALLLEHYTFLKRPVFLYDSKLFVGNTGKVIAEAKAFINEQ